jgi:hypothetical protein
VQLYEEDSMLAVECVVELAVSAQHEFDCGGCMEVSRRHDHTRRSRGTIVLQSVRSFTHRITDRVAPLPSSVPDLRETAQRRLEVSLIVRMPS